VLNKRLDILKELYIILQDQSKTKQGHYLETAVVWILIIEVILEIFWKVILKGMIGFSKA
jgi:uncharacterized Rmd1/YagE family protein